MPRIGRLYRVGRVVLRRRIGRLYPVRLRRGSGRGGCEDKDSCEDEN